MIDRFATCVVAFEDAPKGATVRFQGVAPDHVSQLVAQFLGQQGFQCVSGDPSTSVWSRGSRAGRLLGGGLVKRAKYQITVVQFGPAVQLSLVSLMSGISGSVVGVVRERKQRKELAAALRSYLAPLMASPAPAAFPVAS